MALIKPERNSLDALAYLNQAQFAGLQLHAKLSLAELVANLGAPDRLENSQCDLLYAQLQAQDFPLILFYGDLEFHFSSASCLICCHCDAASSESGQIQGPAGWSLQHGELWRLGAGWTEWLSLAAVAGVRDSGGRELQLDKASADNYLVAYQAPYSYLFISAAGVEVGFEYDDPEGDAEPRLRWLSWSAQTK